MNVQDIRYVLQCADTVYHNGSSYDTKSGILAAADINIAFERNSALYLISIGFPYACICLLHLYSIKSLVRI